MFEKYQSFMSKLNNYFNDSNFSKFEYTFPLKIKDEFLSLKNIKINEILYKELLKLTLQFKLKLQWLVNELKLQNQSIESKIESLTLLKEKIFENDNLILENIIQSNELIHSNAKFLNYKFLLKENFIVNENKIFPLLYNFEEIKYEKQIHSANKLVLNINQKKVLASIELNFNRNIDSDIIISYKEKQNTQIKYTSPKIKLSKNKLISLNFQNCSQLIIYSNANFVDYLQDIKLKGSNDEIDQINLKGIIEIPSYKKILINSNKNFSFFQYSDNQNELIPIENNLINEINTNKILFTINTNEVMLEEFKIFGIGELNGN